MREGINLTATIPETIFINVVDTVDLCTRAIGQAKETGNDDLDSCARSVLSATVFHLGKRHANIPVALKAHYEYLIRTV